MGYMIKHYLRLAVIRKVVVYIRLESPPHPDLPLRDEACLSMKTTCATGRGLSEGMIEADKGFFTCLPSSLKKIPSPSARLKRLNYRITS